MLPFEREQLQDFEQRTGMRWREVRPESLRHCHYGHLADRYAVFLCTTDNCRSGIYLVPAGTQPQKPTFYAQLLSFCKDAGLKLLPSFKCDLDEFPAVPLPPVEVFGSTWSLSLKLDGDLVFHKLGTGELTTYTVGELASFNASVRVAAEDYMISWKPRFQHMNTGNSAVEIGLGNSITHENVSVGVDVTGETLAGQVTFYQAKTSIDGWGVEGQIALMLQGARQNRHNGYNPAYVVGGGIVSGYMLYRIVRMMPSLVPPLWWTMPENAAIP